MSEDVRALTRDLAAALGLPKHTTRAVLTLEVDQPPRLEVTAWVLDRSQSPGPFLEVARSEVDGTLVQRLARVQFMLRLEQFKPTTTEQRHADQA